MKPVPPKARLAATAIAVVATFILNQWLVLATGLVAIIVLLARSRLIRPYLRFAAVVLIPLTIMLMIIWGVVTRAPPGARVGSDPSGGIHYAILIALRVAVSAGVLQLAVLSIPPRLLPATLKGWGLRGDGLVVTLGAFAVGPELTLRADQIVTARRARGMLTGSWWAGLWQMPRLLRPLFVWSIRSAVQRADLWHQRALLLKVDRLSTTEKQFSSAGGLLVLALALAFLLVAMFWRWGPAFNGLGVR
jgi:energy-coupling factor transporter transmembrane protein EcfT